jgi:hypothetical protein
MMSDELRELSEDELGEVLRDYGQDNQEMSGDALGCPFVCRAYQPDY